MTNQSGRMGWNTGGWLGAQIGGSCWMLVAGLLSIPANQTAAITVLGLFGLANLAGWLIWRCRDSLSLTLSCPRHWLASGIPINVVSRWLAHSNLATTLIYLEILPDSLDDMARLP